MTAMEEFGVGIIDPMVDGLALPPDAVGGEDDGIILDTGGQSTVSPGIAVKKLPSL